MLTAQTPTAPPRVLVIDDEEVVRKHLKLMLTRANYDVVTCTNGREALELLRNDLFDCVITDAIMPEISGYDLVKAIRRNPEISQIPVLMLTRKRNPLDVKKAVEAGVNDYILKPVDEHLLLDKVGLCLRKNSAKRHVYDYRLNETDGSASLKIPCRIVAISESILTMHSPIPLSEELAFQVAADLFKNIGIDYPYLKLISCETISGEGAVSRLNYESQLAFVGAPDSDLKKIRSWVQKQVILLKK